MNLSSLKIHLLFSKSQRLGLLALFTIIVISQYLYFFVRFDAKLSKPNKKQEWIAIQHNVDSLKLNKQKNGFKNYPYNPNFITDFKGYKLGMSVAEIDRLLEFRKTNRYVNSAAEFQSVTKVSDSLLKTMSPLFKFPDWVTNKNKKHFAKFEDRFKKVEKLAIIDINQATAEDLKKIYGIGDGLSARILKEKEKFGNFVHMDQIKDVWGLSPEVIEKLNNSFAILQSPTVSKIKINELSLKELMQFPYFRYQLAKAIITYRSMNGKINNSDDLAKITGFPVDKIEIIALYLIF